MSHPISPPPERGHRWKALPAYLSNGFIGLRVRENPLQPGMAVVAGLTGQHPERRIEAIAAAPYPLSGEIALDGLWMSDFPTAVTLIDQTYNFETAELTSRFRLRLGEYAAHVSIETFCSRSSPTLVCQETSITPDTDCDVWWRATIDAGRVRGQQLDRRLSTPAEPSSACDGVLLWETLGQLGRCGIALATDVKAKADRSQLPWDKEGTLSTIYKLRGQKDRTLRFKQIASLVPQAMHVQPDFEAVRLVADGKEQGYERLRQQNRDAWRDIWKSRIRIASEDEKWQALADAAFFYVNTSVHSSSPASTSIYGLATWHDYHYYYGHVMWDVDAFGIAPLSLLQPEAARALLDFRSRTISGARNNARLRGRRGLQFPWEAGPSTGEEATQGAAASAMREEHINLHVAQAFGLFADATENEDYLRNTAWEVMRGVSNWIVERVSPAGEGFTFKEIGGAGEREQRVDNDALTVMAAKAVLRRAVEAAKQLDHKVPARWVEVERGLSVTLRSDGVIASHADYRKGEEKGATPGPLAGLFPYWFKTSREVEQATLDFYLEQWKAYVGAPMFSALYGVWAAWTGNRRFALQMLEEGFAKYQYPRFAQTLEYRLDHVKHGIASGPFFANNAGFLYGVLFGLTGLRISSDPPTTWAQRPVVLPEGWQAISCDRLWIRGEAWRLTAKHGDERAQLTPL